MRCATNKIKQAPSRKPSKFEPKCSVGTRMTYDIRKPFADGHLDIFGRFRYLSIYLYIYIFKKQKTYIYIHIYYIYICKYTRFSVVG